MVQPKKRSIKKSSKPTKNPTKKSPPHKTTSMKVFITKKMLTRKHLLELLVAIVSWGGGELLKQTSSYLRVALWFLAFLILVYMQFGAGIERLIAKHLINSLSKKAMKIIPILVVAFIIGIPLGFFYISAVKLVTAPQISISPQVNTNNQAPPFLNGKSEVSVKMGMLYMRGSVADLMRQPHYLSIGEDKLVTIYVENNVLYADVNLYGGDNEPTVKFEHDVLLNEPDGWDMNYDNDALEIVNSQQVPVLQLKRISSLDMVINGFLFDNGSYIFVNEDGQMHSVNVIPNLTSNVPLTLSLKRIFEYPSSKYQGVREAISELG